jgi:hypothetical protein
MEVGRKGKESMKCRLEGKGKTGSNGGWDKWRLGGKGKKE